MAYYVSVIERGRADGRKDFLAGPFRRHGDALRMVGPCRRVMDELRLDPFGEHAVGTCHVKTTAMVRRIGAGKFNDRLGIGGNDE